MSSWAERARKAGPPPSTTDNTNAHPSVSPQRTSTPPPPVIDYYTLPTGHILTLPTEPLGSVLEYLPMGDVVRCARLCKRFHAVSEMDFVWQSQLNSLSYTVQAVGFPFAELPRHFYIDGGGSQEGVGCSGTRRTLTGKEVSETKRKVMATVRFHNHDSRRAVFLPDLQPANIPGTAPPTGRFSFRRCDAMVKPEHERFLLTSLTTNFYGGTDQPVRRLMDAFSHWSIFDQDRSWGDEEVRTKFSLFDTTETEDPTVLHQLLIGISPHGPGGRGNPLHFGRSARLVEVDFPMTSNLLLQYGTSWLRSVMSTFHFDPRVTRYFTGPELCADHYVGLIVIDPLRVLLLRDRQPDYEAPHAGLMAYNQDNENDDVEAPTRRHGGRTRGGPSSGRSSGGGGAATRGVGGPVEE